MSEPRETKPKPSDRPAQRPPARRVPNPDALTQTLPLSIGHYALLNRLGRGGMGEVFVARDTRLRRLVAIKRLAPASGWESQARIRFEREARAIAALRHPNVVTIHSVEEEDGAPFLTMELVEGEPLSSRMSEGGLGLADFLELALPLSEGVAAAHAAGITHRDLKPDNVLVGSDGVLKVLDFGLARFSGPDVALPRELEETGFSHADGDEEITEEGRVMGTLSYMSPEQANGEEVDPRSDVFSLGVIFIELLTGRRRFEGVSHATMLAAIGREQPAGLADRRDDLPVELRELVERCVRLEPERRPADAGEVARELRAIQAANVSASLTGIEVRPSVGPSPRRRLGRRALGAGLVVAAVSAALLLGGHLLGPSSPAAAAKPAVRLAVVPPAADEGPVWLASLLREAIPAALSEPPELRVVGRLSGEASAVGAARGPSHDARLRIETAPNGGSGFTIRLRVEDALSGRELSDASAVFTGPETLSEGLAPLVGQAAERAGAEGSAERVRLAFRRRLPSAAAALPPYGTGLAALEEGRPEAAISELAEAARLDPLSVPIALAELRARRLAGDSAGARELVASLESRLDAPEGPLGVALQAEVAEATGDWSRAAELHERVLRSHPLDAEAAFRLLRAHVEAGDGEEARRLASTHPSLALELRSSPAYLLLQARTASLLGEPERQRELAQEAARAAESQADRWTLGRALVCEAEARSRLGDLSGAALVLEQARRSSAFSGDAEARLQAVLELAAALEERGRNAEALELVEQELAVSPRQSGSLLHAAAGLTARLGRPVQADLLDRRALLAARATGGQVLAARALRSQALRAWEWGASALALQLSAASLPPAEDPLRADERAASLLLSSLIHEDRGELPGAILAALAAEEAARRGTRWLHLPAALRRSARLAELSGELEVARGRFVEAILEADRSPAAPLESVLSRWELAAFERRRERPEEARSLLAEAADRAAAAGLPAFEAASLELLARLADALGRSQEARLARARAEAARAGSSAFEAGMASLRAGLDLAGPEREALGAEQVAARLVARAERSLLQAEPAAALALLESAARAGTGDPAPESGSRAALEFRRAAVRRSLGQREAAARAFGRLADDEKLEPGLRLRAASASASLTDAAAGRPKRLAGIDANGPADAEATVSLARREIEVAMAAGRLVPLGDLGVDEVAERLELAAVEFAASGDRERMAWARRTAAEILAGRDRLALAIRVLGTLVEDASPRAQALDLAWLGELQSRNSRDEEALSSFARALELVRGSDALAKGQVASRILARGRIFALAGAQLRACDILKSLGMKLPPPEPGEAGDPCRADAGSAGGEASEAEGEPG